MHAASVCQRPNLTTCGALSERSLLKPILAWPKRCYDTKVSKRPINITCLMRLSQARRMGCTKTLSENLCYNENKNQRSQQLWHALIPGKSVMRSGNGLNP